jgi:predicted ATPase
VAKASLLRHTRRLYHKQIAQVLERQYAGTPEAHPELIAQHYTQAGLLREAVGYWQQAGQRALAQSAHVEAAGHLCQGLEALAALPESPERRQQELRFLLALGPAMIATRGYAAPEVGQVYNRAHTLCQMGEQTPQHFPVLVGLWNFYLVRAELQTAYGLGQQCWHLAQQSHDTTLSLEARAMLGVTQFFLGEFPQARTHLEQSMALQDLAPSPAASLQTAGLPVVACSAYLAFILWFLGYPAQAQSQSQKALSLARHVGHPYSLGYALTILGWVQQFLTGGEDGREFAETTQTIAAEHGFPFWEAQSRILFGRALCQHGQVDTGLAAMRQGLQVYQATGAALSCPFFLAHQAEIYAQTGDTTAGLEVVSDALTLTEHTGERWCAAELYRLRGVLLLAQQGTHSQWQAAEESLRQALEIAREQHAASLELRAAMDLSRLWRQQGKAAAARQVLADVYERFAEGLDTADLRAAATLLHELT